MGCSSSHAVAASEPTHKKDLKPQDFASMYAVSGKIGRGSYAQVHIARSKRSFTGDVAVKIRNLRVRHATGNLDGKSCKSSYKEVCVWSRVGSHPNCVRMYESFFDDNLCYMVMEMCTQSLIEYIMKLLVYSESSLAEMFASMLQGIAHLHSLRIIHQDVKPDNFLVGGDDQRTVKLADFGLSMYVPEGRKVLQFCGTPPYMCPEMLQHRPYDMNADIWSFGVICYLLLCGSFPYTAYDGRSATMKAAIAEGGPPKCNMPWLSNEAIAFLKCLLDRDPLSRASVEWALGMPFIVEGCQASEFNRPSLSPQVRSAIKTGAFEAVGIAQTSPVDVTLNEMQKGMLISNTRVLSQSHIDDFFSAFAGDGQFDHLVEDFFHIECIGTTQQGAKPTDNTMSRSTTCVSQPSQNTSHSTSKSPSSSASNERLSATKCLKNMKLET